MLGAAVLLIGAGCDGHGSSGKDGTGSPLPSTSTAVPSVSSSPSAVPLAKAEGDVRAAQAAYYAAYMAAVAKPGNSRLVDRLLGVYQSGSPGQRGMKKYIKALATNGFAAQKGPKSTFVVQSVDVSSVAEGAKASAVVCTYDDGVTYDAKHDGPDGKPIVIDDSVSSARTKFGYVLQAGQWKLTGGDVTKTWAGVNRCSAAT
jgi:hypothetical protein